MLNSNARSQASQVMKRSSYQIVDYCLRSLEVGVGLHEEKEILVENYDFETLQREGLRIIDKRLSENNEIEYLVQFKDRGPAKHLIPRWPKPIWINSYHIPSKLISNYEETSQSARISRETQIEIHQKEDRHVRKLNALKSAMNQYYDEQLKHPRQQTTKKLESLRSKIQEAEQRMEESEMERLSKEINSLLYEPYILTTDEKRTWETKFDTLCREKQFVWTH